MKHCTAFGPSLSYLSECIEAVQVQYNGDNTDVFQVGCHNNIKITTKIIYRSLHYDQRSLIHNSLFYLTYLNLTYCSQAVPEIFTTYDIEEGTLNGRVHYISGDGKVAIAYSRCGKWLIQPAKKR